MLRLRSVLSLLLVVVTTFLVSCSSPSAAKIPDTYNADRMAQIQTYLTPVEEARAGMDTLGKLVKDNNWIDTRTYIHGPFGFLRRDLTYLANTLLPSDKAEAKGLVDEIFDHLVHLDAAAKDNNVAISNSEYRNALSDFEAFLQLVPESAS